MGTLMVIPPWHQNEKTDQCFAASSPIPGHRSTLHSLVHVEEDTAQQGALRERGLRVPCGHSSVP